ncbi:MAG TPA: hypothetical protein VK995_04565 [Oceanipulchritudo sp.]|nr:hypothetical protein [Oceanipulchritudo sp.]
MGSNKEKQKITVETLLQLKRTERPSDDFWDSFEKDFHRRRLHALVEKGNIRDLFWNPFSKALAFGLPALMLAGMTVFWSRTETSVDRVIMESEPVAFEIPVIEDKVSEQPSGISRDTIPELNTSMASSQFVVDAIQSSSGPSTNFRKVLYTPAIRLSSPSGAFYVKDNLSSQNYQVTTADLKLGRNF